MQNDTQDLKQNRNPNVGPEDSSVSELLLHTYEDPSSDPSTHLKCCVTLCTEERRQGKQEDDHYVLLVTSLALSSAKDPVSR